MNETAAVLTTIMQTATIALFAISAYFVKGFIRDVKDLSKIVHSHGERLARLEATREEWARRATAPGA